MSNEVQNRESTQDRISRLTPAQRAMLEKRLKGERRPDQPSKLGIQRRPTLDYSVTAEQEHLWVLQQVDPNVYYFNHAHAYRLKGEFNVAAMERAINEMVRRHENFRTTMPEVGGKPRAVVAPQLQIPVERVDVPEFPVEDLYDRLQALVTAGTLQPFDIQNQPMIRAALYRVNDRDHVVQVTMHHLVTDFVSYDLVDSEIFTLYDAFARGLPSPLPDPAVQYGDFAEWQNQWMQSAEAARQTDYWVRKLANLPRLDLVTDMPRPRIRSYDGLRITWEIPETLWLQFQQVALAATATRFAAFLALFAMLLREYTGSDDIPVATPVSSRKHRETQPLIGYFLNTIVFRVDLSGNPTFRELLQRTRIVTLEAMANSDLPFEVLMNKLGAERDPSRPLLVDTSYAFGNDHKSASSVVPGSLVLEEFDTYYRSAWLDINLGVNDNTDHAIAVLDYLTALFLPSTAERMMLHYQRLFAQGVEDPDRRLNSFSLLSDVERQQILAEWNDTAAPYPSTQTIPACFAMQVAQAGNAIALRSAYGELTYRELNAQANRLAHRLIEIGVTAETRVAILMERSPEMVVATLAVLKAGGAYLPLHSAYPLERMHLIMEEAGAAVLLLDRRSAEHGPVHFNTIVVDDDPYLLDEQDNDPDVPIATDQLAYVIYTSGSTGTPKGVAVTHGNVLSLAFDGGWKEGSLDRVLFHSSHAFDASTHEMWSTLLRGKQLIVAPPGELDIAVYKRLFQEENITSAFLTSSLFHALVQEAPECFLHAREIWTGGDVVPVATVQRLREYCPQTLLTNVYGPTETTTFATHYAVAKPEELTASVPIGAPMENHQVYVLNSVLEPVAVGIPGELFIAGAGVARGYLNQPDLTSERFLPTPSGNFAEHMYRTGDRVRWQEDGQLEFLGRTDQQVKVRGYRIELAEIEAALTGFSDVGQAAVLAREDRANEKKLVAYVVPAPGRSIDVAELRNSLSQKLPDYMVPAFIKVLPALPLNSNGKLNRKELPAPEVTGTGPRVRRAPRNQAEEILCSLLKELLTIPEIATDDNFFTLGGDSILAIQLVSRARQAGLIITLTDVFQQADMEALAAAAHFAEKSTVAPVDIGEGSMPPTPMMCWYLEHGGSLHRFSQSMQLQVPANVKHEHLVLALQTILDSHDGLRLRFTGAEGGSNAQVGKNKDQWKLEIQPKGAVNAGLCLHVIDVQGLDDDARHQKMGEEARAAGARLSAERGIMLQAVWFDRGRSAHGDLLLTIHHLCMDGVSWRILVPDFADCIAAITSGKTPLLEPSPVSFRGWAQRLNREALNPERVKELPFWTNTSQDAAELLPGFKIDPSRDTAASLRQLHLTLPASVTALLLGHVVGAFHAHINDVLLAALALSIVNWRRKNSREGTSVLIDLEGHGREAITEGIDLSRTVGFFTTMFPVRIDPNLHNQDSHDQDSRDAAPFDLQEAWAGGKALGNAVKAIKEQLSAVPSHGIGYGLLRYLNPETERALSGLPESQLDFNYLGRFPATNTGGDWAPSESLSGGIDPDMPYHHPLEVDSMVLDYSSGPELTAIWSWLPTAFSEQDIRLLADGWFHVLETLVHHCDKAGMAGLTPSDLPLVALSQSEIEQIESEYGEIQDILPLTPVQEGILFHAFYDVATPDVYNVQVVLTLEGTVDETALQEAARALLRRHPNLRVAFKHQDLARPVQIIPKEISLPFQTLDFSSLEENEQERRLAELIAKDRVARFQLDTCPLFRFQLVRCSSQKSSSQKFRLLITTHHTLIDGWSLPLMLRDFLVLYTHRGSTDALPRVAPFRDYLAWLARQDRKAAEAAWREALAGIEGATRLSAAGSLREPKIPERKYLVLEKELTSRLTEHARSRSLTLNNMIQAAWAILLSRYTGRDDVVFGSTVSGRNPEINGIENMIGLLINTLPTRVQLHSTDSFNNLLSRLSQAQSASLPHQYLGLLEIQRITGMNELFDTLVIFENFPMNQVAEEESFGGMRLAGMDTNDAAHYPLCLLLGPGERLAMGFDYQPDCFPADFIDALSHRFLRLLEACADDPDQAVSCIDLLSEQERRQILGDFNQTRTDYPRDRTMMELFAEQVRRRGDEPAVICGEEQLSYAEIDRRSNQLGRYLANLGVGPEKLVGISMERSIEVVLAMLAILKAGGAYVPIDPAYPPDRLRFMVEDSGILVLLTKGRLVHQMPEIKAPILALDRDWDDVAKHSDRSFLSPVFPENLAYVIYTSGSTGLPKATAVSQRSMIRLLRDTNYIQFQGDEVVAQTVNLSFDPATFEIWGAMLNGCSLVIIGNENLLDVNRFAAEIKDKDVKVMFLATSLFNEMGRQNPAMFNSVKYLLFGGEAVHPGSAAAVLEAGGPENLVNAYGPAECTTFTSCYRVQQVAKDAASVPIGKPVSNTHTYVLDSHQNLEPVGAMGNLYIGGEGLARGYWHKPALTAEKYLPNPYGQPGERMYSSGDLARWMKDGNLEFFGRADSQIKIRSFRVELGEIEVALLQHSGVRNCAVLMKTVAGNKRLVAYISGEASADELKNYLKTKLPDYMVPNVFMMLPELPLSTNGKVDRRALPDVKLEHKPTEAQGGAPVSMTAIEELLIDIWTQVLGATQIGVRDSFYDLGGESLLALRIVSRINDYFRTELSVRTLLEFPVLTDFAQQLQSISGRPAEELEKIARIGLMVRRMTPEQRKTALAGRSSQ